MLVNLTPYPIAEAGSNDVICEDDSKYMEEAQAENYTSILWRTSGDGFFDDIHSINPIYSPGFQDIRNGSVNLYLTVTGIPPCNTPAEDSITLNIQRNPVVYAGPDTVIGEWESFTTVDASASYTGEVSWNTLGDGNFLFNSGVLSYYIPGDEDVENKGVYLVISGTSRSPCASVSNDTMFLMITPIPKADAGEDVDICEGSDLTISTASAEEYSEIYSFSLSDVITIDDRLHYVVSFKQNDYVDDPFYKGRLYIDMDKLAISEAEFELNVENKEEAARMFIQRKPMSMSIIPERAVYRAKYTIDENRWYFSYARAEVKFKVNWKKKLFNTTYSTMSELAITDRTYEGIEKFAGRERFKSNDVMNEKVYIFFDQGFWEGYNVIEPDQSIETAIRRLNRKYLRRNS
jgi:hypothetical protein